jgi:hypothetical protein
MGLFHTILLIGMVLCCTIASDGNRARAVRTCMPDVHHGAFASYLCTKF